MAKIEIYTGPRCPYCVRAKNLLASKNVDYTEIDISLDGKSIAEMMERSGGARTIPQIFINDKHYGGSDELHALDQQGKLDDILNG